MRKLALLASCLYVFTVPWDMVTIQGTGTISRLSGAAALGAAVLALAARPKIRRPGAVFWLAAVFTLMAGLSLLWTVSEPYTRLRVFTYAQLLASVWIIQEFARTERDQRSLLIAFCAGAFVPLLEVLNNYRIGAEVASMPGRFTGGGLNANDFGLTLVVGIPIAWHLLRHSGGAVRWMATAYFAAAPLGIMLSASRGSMLTGIVALSIIPLTLPRESLMVVLRAAVVVLLVAVPVAWLVPSAVWDRMATIQQEAQGQGGMSGRTKIWASGLRALPERPLLGSGAGTFAPAVQPYFGEPTTSHNVPLGILVEQGIFGLTIYMALLGACAWTIWQLPPATRTLWAVLGVTWLLGVMSVNWEYRKVTWLFIGLIAAQAPALSATAALRSQARRTRERRQVLHAPRAAAHAAVSHRGGQPAGPHRIG